jgi:hypothetical protein
MILLIGMNTSLMKYPTAPMIAKPIAQDDAIFKYSKIISIITSFIWFSAFSYESNTFLSKVLNI